VAWHHGDDWVGWAPLPPPIEARAADGSRLDEGDDIAPTHWSFIARRHLGSTRLARRLVSPARNVTILARTRDATRFAMRDGRAVNLGPDITLLERQGRLSIPRKRIVEAGAPPRSRGQLVDRDVIRFYRPEAHRTPPRAPERVRLRELRLPGAVERWRQEAERRGLEQALVGERQRLAREHAHELRLGPGAETIAEIRRRQDAEQQAFETHASALRQVLEGRLQARDAARGQATRREVTRGRGRDQGA
jgi:hypothetical protein